MLTGTYRGSLQERVIYGKPAGEAVVEEVTALDAKRVFLITTRSLGGENGLAASIGRVLGDRYAGLYAGIGQGAPRESVLEGAAAARAAKADLIIAVGGGSVMDGAKVILHCLWNNITTGDQLIPGRPKGADISRHLPEMEGKIRMIAVPTTYSGAEFNSNGSATNTQKRVKEAFGHPLCVPQSVILDPAATLDTPIDLLTSTGIKAVDHTVERICSPHANPYSNATAAEALTILTRCLPAIKDNPDDLAARVEGQLAMWLACIGTATGVNSGVSHLIGRVIGARCGVGHGVTSCLTLPSTLRWNAKVTKQGQARIAELMGDRDADPADLVAALVARLDLPGRLRDAGVTRDDLEPIAAQVTKDAKNDEYIRPITGPADVMEVLEMAW